MGRKSPKPVFNQWKFCSDLAVLAYVKQSEIDGADFKKTQQALKIWPYADLVKAERRIARGSLRPYVLAPQAAQPV